MIFENEMTSQGNAACILQSEAEQCVDPQQPRTFISYVDMGTIGVTDGLKDFRKYDLGSKIQSFQNVLQESGPFHGQMTVIGCLTDICWGKPTLPGTLAWYVRLSDNHLNPKDYKGKFKELEQAFIQFWTCLVQKLATGFILTETREPILSKVDQRSLARAVR